VRGASADNLLAVEVVDGPEHAIAPTSGSGVTIGAYDGVHLGHRHVLGVLASLAAERDLATVVVTFDRHPATVVRPQSAPLLLTDLGQRLELLDAAGVERTVVVRFDEARANETAEDFVTEVLVRALGARLVVVGSDFHFGHGRKGNVALLEDMGQRYGFDTVGIALEDDGSGEVVSSTRIRSLVATGDMRGAASLLGRYHQVRGTVERGDGRGTAELGFPTANVAVPPEIVRPGEGVYACFYERPGGERHPAAVSFGRRPTFYDDGAPVLEAFLLDFSETLYGEQARLSFVERIGDQQRFDSAHDLQAQMRLDVEQARAVLSAEPA
jgi:riboflavin kinase/FMN adenylyltransferase